MKKYVFITTMLIVCLALCAAVWPQTIPIEETSVVPPQTTVTATQPESPEIPEIEELIIPEEKAEILPSKIGHDIIIEPEPMSDSIPAEPEIQVVTDPVPEPKDAPMAPELQPTPEPTPAPAPSQTTTDPQPGDMVYVPGFGWLECQGPGEVIHDETIYENGNKIGVMG